MWQDKRSLSLTEPAEQTIPETSGADKGDCSTGRGSDHPITSATSGADKGDGNQTASDCASDKTKKGSPVPAAATSGADNNSEPGDLFRNDASPSLLTIVPCEYNSRKQQLLTLPEFRGLLKRFLDKSLLLPGSYAMNLLGDKPKMMEANLLDLMPCPSTHSWRPLGWRLTPTKIP